MPSREIVSRRRFSTHVLDFVSGRPLKMRACISLDRYSRLCRTPVESRTWIDAVNRLLRSRQRPDPSDRTQLKWWNYGDLADVADVRANTLSDIINAKREPSIDTIDKLAKALEVPAFFMLMTDAEQATYLRGRDQKEQETTAATLRSEMRDFFLARFDTAFDKISGEFTEAKQAPVDAPAVVVSKTAKRKRA